MDVKLKMTLWYMGLAMATALVIGLLLWYGAQRISDRYYDETLAYAAVVAQDELEYEMGELEIDANLNDVPDVHISLYTFGGTLLYGRNQVSLPFEEGSVRKAEHRGESWYVLDTLLHFDWRSDVWLRCMKRSGVQSITLEPVFALGAILLPLMILLTGAGGYLIARAAFKPVREMAQTASKIVGGGDLGKRVGLAAGSRDELKALASTLDEMLERLEQAFCRERQFTSDAAHELRTPLNAMRLLCDSAMREPDGAAKDALVEELSERVDSMSDMVKQLLAFSRMEAGRDEMRMTDADLTALLSNVARELSPVAVDRGITIQTKLQPNVHFRCDSSLMTRLVANLLSNAIRYGRDGGHAVLSLNSDEGNVLFTVCDDGEGISQENLPHIWERFWRADQSRHSSGTGLGLAIAKWIIDCHGGCAEVQSKLNEGTEIKIKFPR